MSQRRNKRPQCSQDNCGSRRFHVGDDGFTYCDQGHQQSELGTVVAEDTGELVTLGKTSKRKDNSDAESVATSKATGFSGPRAFEHYLLCVQLVLRKQLRWLIEVQNLPQELETVVRDLWALRLQKVQSKVSYDSETDTEAVFSSQSERGSGTDTATATSQRSRQESRKKPTGPHLSDVVCLVHIGIMLLRIPHTIGDLHKWISRGEMVFYCASKELPTSMRHRLPGYLQEYLEPQDLLAPEALHRNMLEMLTALNSDFGMVAPPLNHPLILYRWIQELSLPLEIYVASQRLARLFDIDFAYSLGAKAWTNMSLRFPEIRLMTLVVITVKVLFPFDDRKRYPKSARDPAALAMDWKLWAQLHSHGTQAEDAREDEKEALTFKDAFNMTEAESLDLAGERLDQYLDWYERNMASEEVRERGRAGREADFRRALFKMFPAKRKSDITRAHAEINDSGLTSAERLLQIQAALRPKRIVPDDGTDNIPRAGSLYPQHRSVEELDHIARVFYDKVAELAGFSIRGLVRAVFLMEQRLLSQEKDLKE